jgi:small multidrug resistance family-3 protein
MAPHWTFLTYLMAGVAEIAGCYAFWAWLRLGHSPFWLAPGLISLAVFAFLLTRIDAAFAGRAYAAYAGVYLLASLGWLGVVEGKLPDRWDIVGGAVSLAGAAIILFGPRPTPA